jgi:hypothetical protein
MPSSAAGVHAGSYSLLDDIEWPVEEIHDAIQWYLDDQIVPTFDRVHTVYMSL